MMMCKICKIEYVDKNYIKKYCDRCYSAYRQGYKSGFEQAKLKFQKVEK